MTLKELDNLVRTKQLKIERPDQRDFDALVESAAKRLKDSKVAGLSEEGRFLAAYGAAHLLGVAALRWHGYRSGNRNLVFQCLQHTVGLEQAKWRVLDKCHKQRNIAEYLGTLEVTPQLLQELLGITEELLKLVEAMGSVKV